MKIWSSFRRLLSFAKIFRYRYSLRNYLEFLKKALFLGRVGVHISTVLSTRLGALESALPVEGRSSLIMHRARLSQKGKLVLADLNGSLSPCHVGVRVWRWHGTSELVSPRINGILRMTKSG